jgi:hypothetical protein
VAGKINKVAQTFLSAAPRFISAFFLAQAKFNNRRRTPRRISALQTRMSAPHIYPEQQAGRFFW